MLIDAMQLPGGSVLETDVCIVGSGPAGVAVAQELDRSGQRVLVLETGGSASAPALDQQYRSGGNASRWTVRTAQTKHGVRLLPLSDVDFEVRPSVPHSGWPITRVELEPYYRRAQRVFGLEAHDYDPSSWEDPSARALPIGGDRVHTGIFQFGIGETISDRGIESLHHSSNVTLLCNAKACELLANEERSRVEAVKLATASRNDIVVNARRIVIAGGGLAAAELLLSSGGADRNGLANDHDVVGRYFMDHPLLLGGEFVPASKRLFEAMDLYDIRNVRGTSVMGHLTINDDVLRREPLLNLSMLLFPRRADYNARAQLSARQQMGVEAAQRVRHSAVRDLRATDIVRAAQGADGILRKFAERARYSRSDLNRGGWSQQRNRAGRYGCFEVLHQAEQAPHPDNRIVLTHERDAFGRRKLELKWQFHDEDAHAIMRAQDTFAAELKRAGLGDFRIARDAERPVIAVPSTNHPMGATRMSSDPRSGVVDRNCRVHGIDNLFISSSSVFPTGGFANPTLTIVALSLRLADHLKEMQRAS